MLFYSFFIVTDLLQAQQIFDLQGHRGARGLMPENQIHGFIEAVKLGVTTLELDVVVSKDKQIVVSHEPWMNAEICEVDKNKEKYNIYQMTYDVKAIDCGSKFYARFPEQQRIPGSKPTLSMVIDSVEQFIRANNLSPVRYNIETKTTPEGDGIYHPTPKEFVNLLYDVIVKHHIKDRTIIQSFDPRTLNVLHQLDSTVSTALLIFNTDMLSKNLKKLDFKPTIYSPNYILVKRSLVKSCHSKGIKIIPWTVNEYKTMLRMKSMGVDGLITDYPNRAKPLLTTP